MPRAWAASSPLATWSAISRSEVRGTGLPMMKNLLAERFGLQTHQSYTPVPRVLALIDGNGNVNSSTVIYNIFDTNNPRSAYTLDAMPRKNSNPAPLECLLETPTLEGSHTSPACEVATGGSGKASPVGVLSGVTASKLDPTRISSCRRRAILQSSAVNQKRRPMRRVRDWPPVGHRRAHSALSAARAVLFQRAESHRY